MNTAQIIPNSFDTFGEGHESAEHEKKGVTSFGYTKTTLARSG